MDKIRNILLVEDSPGDIRLAREAFRAVDGKLQLHVAMDGVEAISFLRRQGSHAGAPRPDLILLDLNLPRMDGRQVLAEIKKDDNLNTIPTVILTTSAIQEEVERVYQLRGNCYFTKPVEYEAFEGLLKSILNFWLTIVKLPKQLPTA